MLTEYVFHQDFCIVPKLYFAADPISSFQNDIDFIQCFWFDFPKQRSQFFIDSVRLFLAIFVVGNFSVIVLVADSTLIAFLFAVASSISTMRILPFVLVIFVNSVVDILLLAIKGTSNMSIRFSILFGVLLQRLPNIWVVLLLLEVALAISASSSLF